MREPYPNELYHYGVKGMKWGKRKIRPNTGEHPTTSGSLHKVGERKLKRYEGNHPRNSGSLHRVGEGLAEDGISAYNYNPRRTTEQAYLREVQNRMEHFRNYGDMVDSVVRRDVNDDHAKLAIAEAIRKMESDYDYIKGALGLVQNAKFGDSNTMAGHRIAALAEKTLPSYESRIRYARKILKAMEKRNPLLGNKPQVYY